MKRDWIKLEIGILNNPKYGTLTDDLWRLMIQLTLLAGETDQEGQLPSVRDMAWKLHTGAGNLQIALHQLAERGLVHSTPQGWVVTGFKESQAAPNSTERSRAFRRRRKTETQPQAVPDAAMSATEDATHLQPSRPEMVAPGVPAPDRSAPKKRQRHRSRPGPVEKAVDTSPVDTCPADTCPVDGSPQEKGRKNSESVAPGRVSSSLTSSLNSCFKTSLNIKLPLLELLEQGSDPENFRLSRGKSLETGREAPEKACSPARPPSGRAPFRLKSGDGNLAPEADGGVVDKIVDSCPVNGSHGKRVGKIPTPTNIRHKIAALTWTGDPWPVCYNRREERLREINLPPA